MSETCKRCGRPLGDALNREPGPWFRCEAHIGDEIDAAYCDVVAAAYRRGISDMLAVAKEHAGILFRNEPDDICINWTRVDREAAKLAGENGE